MLLRNAPWVAPRTVLIRPAKPRYTLTRSGVDVSVSIPAPRSWSVLVFLMVWLGLWTVGGASAIAEHFGEGPDRAFMLFWSVGWLCGELYAIAIVLWQLVGREELSFGPTRLIHRLGAFGLARSREFEGGEIKRLRASPQLFSTRTDQTRWIAPPFSSSHGAIAFDYGAKTYRIGAGLDEAEARLVLEEMRKAFPD